MSFLKALREAHEEDENSYPADCCIKPFEEISAVWCEQVRESPRNLCAQLGTENPRMEDLKLLALATVEDSLPNFRFPNHWDLADPQGHYQKMILPRQQRAMSRLLNKQLHEHVLKECRPRPNKAAGAEQVEEGLDPNPENPKERLAPNR